MLVKELTRVRTLPQLLRREDTYFAGWPVSKSNHFTNKPKTNVYQVSTTLHTHGVSKRRWVSENVVTIARANNAGRQGSASYSRAG